MRQGDRQRHQLGRLVAGIAEHQALVAGAMSLPLAISLRPSRCRGFAVQLDITAQVVGVEAHVVVACSRRRESRRGRLSA